MLEKGQKIRNKDGRIIIIIAPVMTEPVTYLVRFADNNEQKVVSIKMPEPKPEPKPESFLDGVFDTFNDIFESMDQEFKNLRNNIRNRH